MSADSRITALVEKALAAGIPQESLVGMLAARGWPEKEIYEALAEYYEHVAGLEIPWRAGSGASAKDAFFYLLIFSTLATWTIGFGVLASSLIDRWLADPLFSGYSQGFDTYTITSSLAALIVAFPLFLLVSRAVAADVAAHPEKLESPIRRWLTYMALVIAAGVFMGDLITALSYLLRGELTSRFLLKALIVLVLSGGVFFYYFGGLKKTEGRSRRDRLMAVVSSAAVALMIVLAFSSLGAPARQREMRADGQRVTGLYRLSSEIDGYWRTHGSTLPTGLNQLTVPTYDPITHKPYQYHPLQGSHYELCANFARSSDGGAESEPAGGADEWVHPAGQHCFQLDATIMTQYPMRYNAY
ncbi:MAG: DUF5671 domain-containing protein [Acidobacteriaceae bacterium]